MQKKFSAPGHRDSAAAVVESVPLPESEDVDVSYVAVDDELASLESAELVVVALVLVVSDWSDDPRSPGLVPQAHTSIANASTSRGDRRRVAIHRRIPRS